MDQSRHLLKKLLHELDAITERKLYSCPCFYHKESPLILITPEIQFAVYLAHGKNCAQLQPLDPWIWQNKPMTNWYLIPKQHCTKKNRVMPIIQIAVDQQNSSKRQINKKKKVHKKNKKSTICSQIDVSIEAAPLTLWAKIMRMFKNGN